MSTPVAIPQTPAEQARAALRRARLAAEALVDADDSLRRLVSVAGPAAVDRRELLRVHAVAGRARALLGRERPDLRDKAKRA